MEFAKVRKHKNGTCFDGDTYGFKVDIPAMTIEFGGRVYFNKIPHPSGNGTISLIDGGRIVYYPNEKSSIGLIKATIDKEELRCCPNCGHKCLYMTEHVEPSMYYEGCYHNYYGIFCPVCMNTGSIIYTYDATSDGPFADWAKYVVEVSYSNMTK